MAQWVRDEVLLLLWPGSICVPGTSTCWGLGQKNKQTKTKKKPPGFVLFILFVYFFETHGSSQARG